MSRAPSIAVARFRLRSAEHDFARNAAQGRLLAHLGLVPINGTMQRVAWERESGCAGHLNRRMRQWIAS